VSENAGFEARGILVPRRARASRLAVLLPVVALLALAWAGASGRRVDVASAPTPVAAAVVASSDVPEQSASPLAAQAPTADVPPMVVGLHVQRLNEVRPRLLSRDDSVALVGWYATTAITDCPPLAAIYRDGARPGADGDVDSWAFCQRKGVFYAAPPSLAFTPSASGTIALVRATIAITVVVPRELEVIGAEPIEVVLVGRFVQKNDECGAATGCAPTFIVDHVAWTAPS